MIIRFLILEILIHFYSQLIFENINKIHHRRTIRVLFTGAVQKNKIKLLNTVCHPRNR